MNRRLPGKDARLVFVAFVATLFAMTGSALAEQRPGRWWAEQLFNRLDANGDGKLTKDEVGGQNAQRFGWWDANGDGSVDVAELRASLLRRVAGGGDHVRPRPGVEPPAGASSRTEAGRQTVLPFEGDDWAVAPSALDAHVLARLKEKGVEPADSGSDQVFLRRAYLDLIGTLPTPEEWLAFVHEDKAPDKRAKLVDALMQRDEFAGYWALKWGDVLRVKAEFPINLWPNAVQAYHRWIRDSVKENKPYDEFARELLTSSGSNFRVPPANFYRAIQGREPPAIAAAVALTFMGTRVDRWPAERRRGFEAFFSCVVYKGTAEWKEEIVQLDPAPTEPLDAVFPDGTKVRIESGIDPRQVFADWLLAPGNPWFAKSLVNRVWSWVFGRGIIHEPDDIRPDNPPTNPELLEYLEKEFVKSNYDLRQLFRLILNSRTYQQSSVPRSDSPEAESLFAHYPVRRLDAEVLIDALCWLCADGESYSSQIPEPFTWVPEDQRTMELADGSITSQFLEMFGRPARDTGLESERNNESSDAQRLYLLNSSDLQRRAERSQRLRGCVLWAKGDSRKLIDALYVNILSREPTQAESEAALSYFQKGGVNQTQGWSDLAWALINSKEFLYRH
ncbi:MAG: hypothetical protein COZ06_26340 [Armatimonadetes bacterium CG_4_10_14_3_um_filter_66_18]|nr:DUF1553 domain-containing protein [Armatimonadota bacterium]OIO93642.1 MAG: hypothetical protein AUJ96_29825 [Armatimonadetes bacterium CG2_30_66_41]PIX41556.1 MAG: hypothetical protein COZ57_23150 [Armatimonadetes bacterium CG_4_8_14_3_um_filter_66_20]PIY41667.1 MAG: hypothetical protein COZ06_26340 [Armatimonadetes bacterium CG_4_10_14_3_um_filter_66_18]PJB69672.1 MAG: hypothetical protein CO096_12630 [Armatimonadetes bacterium CG_4_9_14_3_um_filter_66_14]